MSGKFWSRNEIQLLKNFYKENFDAEERVAEIAISLNRGKEATRKMAFRLKLKRYDVTKKANPQYKINEDGCWIWLGYIGNHGYAVRTINNKQYLVHRLNYESYKGKIPNGLHIDHLCRVRSCVNPYHLEAVLCIENIRRGQNTFLHWYDVLEIRLLAVKFGLSAIEIAEIYSLNVSHASNILKGRIWKSF